MFHGPRADIPVGQRDHEATARRAGSLRHTPGLTGGFLVVEERGCCDHRLRAVLNLEGPENSRDMNLDGAWRKAERLGDLLVGIALRQKGMDQPWPPPFPVHAAIIEKILIYNPKALLIDFGFFDEAGRGDIETLTDVLGNRYEQPPLETHKLCNLNILKFEECEGEVRRVPVFLAGAPRALGSGEEKFRLKVVPALKDAVTGTVSTRYSTEHQLPYNSYPLHDCFTEGASAALAMYAAGNDDWAAWGLNVTPCPDPAQREKRDWQGGPNKLSVYWASWGDAGSSRGSYRCKTLPESVGGRIAQVVWIWLTDLFGSGKAWRDQFQICPPHRSYAAHDFLADENPELAEFLNDRYVFYGGNFAMADDLITPPTHEPVPGVFLHAMALDNLLRRGKRYIRVEGETGLCAATTWLTLAVIAVAGIFTVLAWNGYEFLTKRPAHSATGAPPFPPEPNRSKVEIIWDKMRPFGCYIIGAGWVLSLISISVVVTFLALWVGFSILNLAPINYIGILSFFGVHTLARGGRELLSGVLSGG